MSEFITLKKSDPNFRSHILGHPSKNKVSVPIKHFRLQKEESVTFELIDKKNRSLAESMQIFLGLIRWHLLALTLLPSLVVLLLLRDQAVTLPVYEYLLALGALFLFHCSLFAWNDYRDHVRGWDSFQQKSGTRTIQKGLMTAAKVRALAWSCLIASVLLALPLAIDRWALVLFAGCALGLAGLALSLKSRFLLKQIIDQFMIFTCFGPLLVFGTKYFVSQQYPALTDISFIFVSWFLGWSAALYFQSRQFANLMHDDRQKIKTLAVSLGFDQAKRALLGQLFILVCLIVTWLLIMEFGFWVWFCAIPFLFWLLRLALATRSCDSPLSSNTMKLPSMYLSSHWLLCLWLMVEALF